jgi:hypothetical protein
MAVEMTPEKAGSLVGATFGVVFVVANSDTLPESVTATVRVLAVGLFVVVAVAAVISPSGAARSATGRGRGKDRGFALIVVAEFAAIFAGVAVLNALDAAEAGVAWVCLVVWVHFFALARHWQETVFGRLGAAMTPLGLAGLGLAAADAGAAAIDVVAAIVPGLILLGAALWGVGVRPRRLS